MEKVCQLVHSLNVGGAEVLAERFSRRLGGAGRAVFACLDDLGPLGEQLLREGYAVEVLARKPGLDVACARRLRRFLAKSEVRLVHAHQYTPFFYASLARGLAAQPPILFTEHGRFFPDYPHRKRMWLNPWLIGRRDRVIAVGECVRQALIVNEGFPGNRIEVVYNGVELSRYEDVETRRGPARDRLGLAEEDFAVLIVARLDPIKDHATLLRAMGTLRRRAPRAVLLIAGDGPERSRIEALIGELGLEGKARMLGQRRDVPDLLAACDVFVLSSKSEGIPLTAIEAMAAGRPVVATRVGGLPEVVTDETGVLAPAGDAGGLAEALAALANDPPRRRRLGEAGRERAKRRFAEDQMMAAYNAIYRQMLGEDAA